MGGRPEDEWTTPLSLLCAELLWGVLDMLDVPSVERLGMSCREFHATCRTYVDRATTSLAVARGQTVRAGDVPKGTRVLLIVRRPDEVPREEGPKDLSVVIESVPPWVECLVTEGVPVILGPSTIPRSPPIPEGAFSGIRCMRLWVTDTVHVSRTLEPLLGHQGSLSRARIVKATGRRCSCLWEIYPKLEGDASCDWPQRIAKTWTSECWDDGQCGRRAVGAGTLGRPAEDSALTRFAMRSHGFPCPLQRGPLKKGGAGWDEKGGDRLDALRYAPDFPLAPGSS